MYQVLQVRGGQLVSSAVILLPGLPRLIGSWVNLVDSYDS